MNIFKFTFISFIIAICLLSSDSYAQEFQRRGRGRGRGRYMENRQQIDGRDVLRRTIKENDSKDVKDVKYVKEDKEEKKHITKKSRKVPGFGVSKSKHIAVSKFFTPQNNERDVIKKVVEVAEVAKRPEMRSRRTRTGTRTSDVVENTIVPPVVKKRSARIKPSSSRDKSMKYVDGLIKSYDKDKDGKLSQEEIDAMGNPPEGVDSDNDGFSTKSELLDYYGGGNVNMGGTASFNGLDANNDGQIQMYEYSNFWDDNVVESFYKKDKNGDGVITVKEWD